jgi:hypothetical protein
MCAAALTASLSACSTLPDEAQCPTAERAVEYITRQVPDALLIECLPRLRQADVNPSGTPSIAVVVIRTNNGRLDECIKLHKLLITQLIREDTMPGDSKPDLPVKQKQKTDVPTKDETE